MVLGSKISYENGLQSVNSKINKTSGLLRETQPTLSRKFLVAIFKTFIRPNLYDGDVVFDRASKETCHQSLKFLQYSSEVVITGAIRETSSENISHKQDLETPKIKLLAEKVMSIF